MSDIDFLDVEIPPTVRAAPDSTLHRGQAPRRHPRERRKGPPLSIFLSVPLRGLNLVIYISAPYLLISSAHTQSVIFTKECRIPKLNFSTLLMTLWAKEMYDLQEPKERIDQIQMDQVRRNLGYHFSLSFQQLKKRFEPASTQVT